MEIPSLPTDNYFKFLFFLGVFLIGTGFYIIYNNNENYYAANLNYSRELLENDLQDSLKLNAVKKLFVQSKNALTELDSLEEPDPGESFEAHLQELRDYQARNEAAIKQMDSLKQTTGAEVDADRKLKQSFVELEGVVAHNSYKKMMAFGFVLIGCFLMSFGEVWKTNQVKLDWIATAEYEKLFPKHETCESCSMILENDQNYAKLDIVKRNEYCTNCYNHKKAEFKEPIILTDMELKVKARMMQLGFSDAEATAQAEKIKGLKRWVPHLHWIS